MENLLINDPRAGFIILIVLTIADLFFGKRAGSAGTKSRSEFIEYETTVSRDMGPVAYFALILLKISPPFLIALTWAAAKASGSEIVAILYAGLLGFTLALYLIINLRHLESALINKMVGYFREDLSGKILIRRRFSLGQSTIQIFSIFIIFLVVALVKPTPLFIGFALAPVALIIRNIIVIKK
ncbi:MAG: hypothetical protein V3W18_07365 [candidate division Zixibacteria bacterium]